MADSPPRIAEFTVEEGAEQRLDTWLASCLDISRTRAANLVESGAVTTEDLARPLRKSEPVEVGHTYRVEVPEPEPIDALPEDIPLSIVYEDENLVVVDKNAGLVVHPAPGHWSGTMVNALLHHVNDLSGIGGKLRPGIVHRLDRDTSGLLVVAKDDDTHQGLSTQLKRREVKRVYVALSWGHLSASPVTIDAPIARDPSARKRMAVVPGGRRAVTHIRERARYSVAELLDVSLETGRTHQIRVHLAHCGHPIVGDRLYGAAWERGFGGQARGTALALASRAKRQMLHARTLEFEHPARGVRMSFEAPLPSDFEDNVRWLEEQSE